MIDSRGFTLIEVLVAIVILMIGLLGMLSGIDLALKENVKNTLRNEAVLVADDLMMSTRAKQFISLSTTVTPAFVFDLTRFPESRRYVRGLYKNYSVRRTITPKTPQTKEVVIEVSWNYKNQQYTHAVSSFVSTTNQ